MGWDETILKQPDPLEPRPSPRLTKFEGKCIECNGELQLDEVAISTYEIQNKHRILHYGSTGYVTATYSDTPVEGWINLRCIFDKVREYLTPNTMDI